MGHVRASGGSSVLWVGGLNRNSQTSHCRKLHHYRCIRYVTVFLCAQTGPASQGHPVASRHTLLARRRPRQRYRQRAESCAWKTPKHSQNDTRGTTQHTGFGARPKWFSVLRCLFAPNMLGHGSCVAARHRGIATWPPRVRRAVRRGRRNVAPSWATPPSSLPRTRGQPPPPGYRPGATHGIW